MAIGSAGNIYIAGFTDSNYLPYPTACGKDKVFVTKWDSDLNELLASTCVGGGPSVWDHLSMAVDASDYVYIAGTVNATTSYPVTDWAYQTTYDGKTHAFVSKLDGDLSFLIASTFLGGSNYDQGRALALDAAGNAYIAGFTLSSDFPIMPFAYDISLYPNGYMDNSDQ
jgi:hypothetical protein